MSDDERWRSTRRGVLVGAATAGAAGVAAALNDGGEDGTVYGGIMQLSQSYNVAGNLWIGPDSAKSNVDAEAGYVYEATDTQVGYHYDGAQWVKMGVGSDQEAVPSVTTDGLVNGADTPKPSDGASEINARISDGATVKLHADEYLLSSPVTINARNVTLDLNGATLKVADGANVRPIQIGSDGGSYEHVTIKNGEIDGNAPNQTDTSLRLHGVDIHDVRHVDLENLYIRDTYPDPITEGLSGNPAGGNGVFARPASEDVTVTNCRAVSAGYDGFGMTGTKMRVYESLSIGQSNRAFSGDYLDEQNLGEDVRIVDCIGESGYYPASAFGMRGSSDGSVRGSDFHIENCKQFMRSDAPDSGRRAVSLRAVDNWSVDGLEADGTNCNDSLIIALDCTDGDIDNKTVLRNSPKHGIEFDSSCDNIFIGRVDIIETAEGGIRLLGGNHEIDGAYFHNINGTAEAALYVPSSDNIIRWVHVDTTTDGGVGVDLNAEDNMLLGGRLENIDSHAVGCPSDDNIIKNLNINGTRLDGITIGGADTEVQNIDAEGIGHQMIDDGGTRTRINGTIELGAAPSASNYDATDAGARILDTSVSPPDVYYVLQDGSLSAAT